MELKELEKLTVTKLREMTQEYEDIKGASAMTKDKLIEVLCEKLGIEREVHKEVDAGVDKGSMKTKIKEMKEQRAQAIAGGDKVAATRLRRRIHQTKRRIKKATHVTA